MIVEKMEAARTRRDGQKSNQELLQRVVLTFRTAVESTEKQGKYQYYVIVDRTWQPREFVAWGTEEALRQGINRLRTEACHRHRRRQMVDARIQVFCDRDCRSRTPRKFPLPSNSSRLYVATA
jgi:hypothetical protein